MSKRIIKVGIEVEKAATKELQKTFDEMQNSISSGLSKKFENEIKRFSSSLKTLNKQVGSADDFVDKKVFDEINKMTMNVTKDFDKLLTTLSKGTEVVIDTKQLKETENEIKRLEKSIEELESKTEKNLRLGTKGGIHEAGKENFQNLMKSRYPSFDGTPASLGMTSIRKDIVNVKAYQKAIDLALNSLTELRKKEKSKEGLTKDEKSRLANLENEKTKLEYISKILDETNILTYTQIQNHNDNMAKLKEENAELERQYELKRQIRAGDETHPDSLAILESQTSTDDTKHKLKSSKDITNVTVAEERGAIAQENAERDANKVNPTEIDALIGKLISLTTIFRLIQSTTREVIDTIGELDAAFVDIAVVTQYTNKEVWDMYGTFSKIGKESGFSVSEIAGVAGEYFRQGESYSNVLKLTEAAAKAAKVAGIEASESVRYLTSAVRGYNLAAEDAMLVSDKFAAVAASSATDYDGLATAMSKVAAQAYANGVEMDNLMGMMATAMEVTQEAPENIGTAFKTILARMSEIKDYGKVLEDGVDANKVETALKTVNVALFDQNREMRNLDDVLLEVGSQWHTLNKSQKAYLATTLAGTRQQTRLLAVLENYDKTLENIQTSRDSAGATDAQQEKYTQSIAYNLNRIKVAFEDITKNLANSQAVIKIVSGLASATELIAKFTETTAGKITIYTALFAGLSKTLGMIKASKTFKGLQEIIENSIGPIEKLTEWVGIFGEKFNIPKETIDKTSTALMSLTKKGGGGIKKFAKTALSSIFSLKGAAVLAVAAIGYGLYKLSRRAEDLKKSIKDLSVEGYNLKQSKKTLQDLADEYEALDRKVIKTTEDIKRMKEIAQLMADTDTEGDYDFVGSDGFANIEKVNMALKAQNEKIKENFKDQAEANAKLTSYFHKLDSEIEKFNAAEGLVIKTMFDFDMEAWEEKSEEFKNEATRMTKELIEMGRYIDSEGNQTNVKYQVSSGMDGYETTLNKELEIPEEVVQSIINYKEALVESETSVEGYRENLRGIAGDLYGVVEASDPLLISFEGITNATNVSIENLRKLGQAFDIAESYGIKLDKELKDGLVQTFNDRGIEAFSSRIVEMLSKTEKGIGQTTKMALSLIDVFDDLTLDGLLDNMTTMDSMQDRISKLNDSLENLNTESLRELISLIEEYPSVADIMITSIEQTGEISDAVQKSMLEAEVEKTKKSIRNEIEQNNARIEILKLEKEIAQQMIKDEIYIDQLAADAKADISDLEYENILSLVNSIENAYESGFKKIIDLANQTGIEIPKGLESGSGNVDILSGQGAKRNKHRKGSAEFKVRRDAIVSSLNKGIEGTDANIANLTNINRALELAYDRVGTAAWNNAKGNEKAGKAAKDAAADFEVYLGVLNKLYVAQKKLQMVDWGVGKIEAQRDAAIAAQAVQGLPGAKVGDAGANTALANQDLYAAYDLRKQQLQKLIDVNNDYIKHHESKLDPALRKTYKIIDGQVIPVSSQYKKLTGEQMKVVDEFAKTVNELGSNINDYTTELYAAEQAQNEIIAGMRDAVIEYQELLIDAIKNEEKKHLESFKKIIEGNKKYLEERKKLYEKAFKEEDQAKTQEEIEAKRLELIEKLAALEAAHDITSLQKKEQYRNELLELNDQYNNLTLERNRESFLEAIDDQINYQEEIYKNEEEAHNARIESGEWLEQRLKEIQDEARLQAIIDHNLHNMTIQQMLENGYITQEEITNMGLTDITQTMDQLSNEQQELLNEYWNGNRDIIDKMWNDTGKKVGAVKLSETAMDNILKYLIAHSTQMEGKTSTMREKVVGEWRALMQKVNAYTKDFNAITLKSPNYSRVTTGVNSLLDQVRSATKGIVEEYNRIIARSNAAASTAENNAGRIERAANKASNSSKKSSSSSSGRIANEHGVFESAAQYNKWLKDRQAGKNPNNLSPMATGGVTERTGLHWLDGKPGAPERVLSPGANKEFENLLRTLTVNHQNGGTGEQLSDESIAVLVRVIQSSSAENAMAIIEGLASNGGGMSSIASIARQNGISINKKG